ncbi:F0F1 ATP synthase subunit delta [Psychromonas sp. psych-6C06]|uniref:F0F1 ATP synthase subunit delta n=1 Tax=Psychromonas sp. psych-6C06 TaxID=2058089 RepID=UPI000C3426A0|nr:F0F1 ATP synthase subunit delta [Psychromonas sp. psych-6C06]PKF60723.1 F0F1 ATP synthase subunit delta [Psychromonas sp. psych-6C06]
MSELTTVARPYARAAFEFAVDNKCIDSWSTMLQFSAEVVNNPVMAELLTRDKTATELVNLFLSVCDDQLDEHGQNFIKVMAENGRLSVLPRVALLFSELETAQNMQVDVDVVSAYALSSKQKTEISESLEKRLARKVNLNCSIDKSLVAGMVITAGDLVIDSSAIGQLNRLSNTLQS